MGTYILQRVLQMIPVMILASIISFSIIFLLPGDPALLILGDQLASDRTVYEAKRAELGLDRPLPIQYLDWLGRRLRGDLGTSTRDRQPVVAGPARAAAGHPPAGRAGDAARDRDRDTGRDHLGTQAQLEVGHRVEPGRVRRDRHPELLVRDPADLLLRGLPQAGCRPPGTCRSPRIPAGT